MNLKEQSVIENHRNTFDRRFFSTLFKCGITIAAVTMLLSACAPVPFTSLTDEKPFDITVQNDYGFAVTNCVCEKIDFDHVTPPPTMTPYEYGVWLGRQSENVRNSRRTIASAKSPEGKYEEGEKLGMQGWCAWQGDGWTTVWVREYKEDDTVVDFVDVFSKAR